MTLKDLLVILMVLGVGVWLSGAFMVAFWDFDAVERNTYIEEQR